MDDCLVFLLASWGVLIYFGTELHIFWSNCDPNFWSKMNLFICPCRDRLTDSVMFCRLDWCHSGHWGYQHKTCWCFYCYWCWRWGACCLSWLLINIGDYNSFLVRWFNPSVHCVFFQYFIYLFSLTDFLSSRFIQILAMHKTAPGTELRTEFYSMRTYL